MKIAHLSDIHIRNLKRHDEYRRVFEDLYRRLDELKPDIVVNTGDTAHTKTQISPEFVEMASEHFRRVAEYAPYHVILGNHDLNLMNADRQDAITPIVRSIASDRVRLHKESGPVCLEHSVCRDMGADAILWVFGIGDSKRYPTPSAWAKSSDSINIGLFHGSIARCLTDSDWRMTHAEYDVSIFDGLDYVLMGDIHRQQFMDPERRIGYAGSLIQQNFGEDIDKGFLFWDIRGKDRHEVRHIPLTGARKFYTVKLAENLSLPDTKIDPGSRVRVSPPRPLTLVEQKEVERAVRRRFDPYDVVTLSAGSLVAASRSGKREISSDNLRQPAVQERLLRDWLKRQGVGPRATEMAVEMDRRYHVAHEQQDETARDVSWRLNRLAWSNMFNYGEGNHVDFDHIGGLTGIFAENSRGKSSFIDVIVETLYDKVTKGITKNLHMVHDGRERATMLADLTVGDRDYGIERAIERLEGGDGKEWGKTSVDFSVTADGVRESLNADLRPGTERNIRQRIGSFDDFVLTSLTSQDSKTDVILCRETERKKILYRFLDLDVFEAKGALAREESREWYDRLKALEDSGVQEHVVRYRVRLAELSAEIGRAERELTHAQANQKELGDLILTFTSQKVRVDCDDDPAEIMGRRRPIITKMNELDAQWVAQKLELASLEKKTRETPSVQSDPDALRLAERDLAKAESDLSSLDAQISSAEQALRAHKKKLPLLDEVPCGDQFPGCRFLVDAVTSKRGIPGWEENVRALELKRDDLAARVTGLTRRVDTLREADRSVTACRKVQDQATALQLQIENNRLKNAALEAEAGSLMELVEKAEQAVTDVRKNRELDAEIVRLTRERDRAEREMATVQSQLNELNHERGGQEAVLAKLEAELSRLEETKERVTAFEHYLEAMGKDGIAYEILAQKLPLVNQEINKILADVADFGVVIEHDPEEQSVRLFLQYGEYRPRILELGGGAEKMLASIAIRCALLSVSSLPKSNLFVIDEGFGKLDPKNMEAVGRMFDYLRTVFEHVIVISHIDGMKDLVDNIIEITTDDDGLSHIEV